MAAIVTLGISSTRLKTSWSVVIMGLASRGLMVSIIFTSAPAAKIFSPPHTTTAPTSSRGAVEPYRGHPVLHLDADELSHGKPPLGPTAPLLEGPLGPYRSAS